MGKKSAYWKGRGLWEPGEDGLLLEYRVRETDRDTIGANIVEKSTTSFVVETEAIQTSGTLSTRYRGNSTEFCTFDRDWFEDGDVISPKNCRFVAYEVRSDAQEVGNEYRYALVMVRGGIDEIHYISAGEPWIISKL